MNPRTRWTCADIHEVPKEFSASSKWRKYRRFDGKTLPFPDQTFDAVLFSDVLHHCMENAVPLLTEALRVGHCVIVKDHFEYGGFSRQFLRLMDYIGNYGYGVRIPDSYFSEKTFREACRFSGAELSDLRIGLDLYSGFPFIRHVIKKEWQFIAVLHAANRPLSRILPR
ncbi:MAG: methyltransferase domain-containing protein [Terrimicrobiaceae bacterium]